MLADRAQLDYPVGFNPGNVQTSTASPVDPIGARALVNPTAARVAVRILGRARELRAKFNLGSNEIEESLTSGRPISAEAANLTSLAVQDASRMADALWSSNGRSGRTFKDVDDLIAGRPVEVPPSEEILALLLADDQTYEASLAKILSSQSELNEGHALALVIATLRRPGSPDKTLSECQKHASWMARTIGGAVGLIKRNGSLKAALAAGTGTEAAKAIEYFIRMRPEQGSSAAIRTFEAALRDYQHDSTLLEPLLGEHGNRTIGNVSSVRQTPMAPSQSDVGSLIQRLREARYASRHLPDLIEAIRASIPKALFHRIFTSPIDEASAILESGRTPTPRIKAASELRQLRELFASTGFGDPLEAPADFEVRTEQASATSRRLPHPPQTYSPEVLDLLLELTTFAEQKDSTEWPTTVTRAKTFQEATDAIHGWGRFDVVVVDDVLEHPSEMLSTFEATGATVHRIGVPNDDAVFLLEIPHRHSKTEIAAAVSGQPNRWMGAPSSFGVLVRADPKLQVAQLSSAADRLVAELRDQECNAALASSAREADVIVGFIDMLRDTDLPTLAEKARLGLVVLCRSDHRSPGAKTESNPAPDITSAQALGWNLSGTTIDGTVLEKGGRSVALINEPIAISSRDETIADVTNRLAGLGWLPVVMWRDSARASEDLENVLTAHSVSAGSPFRRIAETFDLTDPQPPSGNKRNTAVEDNTSSSPTVIAPAVENAQQSAGYSTTTKLESALPDEPALIHEASPVVHAHFVGTQIAAGREAADAETNVEADRTLSDSAALPEGIRLHSERSQTEVPPVIERPRDEVAPSHPPEVQAQPAIQASSDPSEAAEPQQVSSSPARGGLRIDLRSPQEASLQIEDPDADDPRETADVIATGNEPEFAYKSLPDTNSEDAPGLTQELERSDRATITLPASTPAVFRDRRGARRPANAQTEQSPRPEGRSARTRQGEVGFRLTIDPIRRRIQLSAVLSRPEGFSEEITISRSDEPTQAFDLSRYDDIDTAWTPDLLEGEFRLKDETQRLEWLRTARPFQIFAAAIGEPDLMTISAAVLGGENTIVCREADASTIEAIAIEAGSPALKRFAGFQGVPNGWTVLGGYVPSRGLASPPAWLKPLDPGADIQIIFSDGFKIRAATYAQGEPPRVLIEGMPSNCEVFIGGQPAEMREDGSWFAPGWDMPAKHVVDIVPGPSQSYEIVGDPAYGAGWVSWSAHEHLVPAVAGAAAICGAMVACPKGRTVLAIEPASSIVALGAQHQVKTLSLRQDAPAAISALSFEPLFVIVSSGGRRANGKILVLDYPAPVTEPRPETFSRQWIAAVRGSAARRIPIQPETAAAKEIWGSATRAARRWRRNR